MTEEAQRRRQLLDFAHTVRVVTARSLAGEERISAPKAGSRAAVHTRVTALAAAAAGTSELPLGEILARDGQLSASFIGLDGTISVVLQLKGFTAITAHAHRGGRLFTRNGTVDYRFQFDARGKAVCILLDAPEVREGLHDLDIEIDAPST